jgi:hypothetical protein
MASLEVFTRDTQLPISLGACGKAHLVIVTAKVFQLDVFAILDVAEESERIIPGDSVEHANDLLDFLVVRGDPVSDQAERSWEAVEHVDGHAVCHDLEQPLSYIECGRTRPDDGNSQWLGHGAWC